jgi:TRAP transporter TAXI family solute receptor
MSDKREHDSRFEEFTGLTWRGLLLIAVPSLVLVVGAFWLAAQFIEPLPPQRIVLAAGPEGSALYALGQRYRAILARSGIALEVRATRGAGENVDLLAGGAPSVDAAFLVAGTVPQDEAGRIENISNLSYAPVWGLERASSKIETVAELRGKRIAVGAPGSGIEAALAPLLAATGITPDNTTLLRLSADDSLRALEKGEVDIVFHGEGLRNRAFQEVLHSPDIRLIDFPRTEAYTRRFAHLVRLDLPEGTIDLARNIPDRNLTLIGTTVMVAARAGLHPTVVELLVDAARETSGVGGIFERRGEFPNMIPVDDVPVSAHAVRYARDGPSLFRRYLPLWLAGLLQRAFTLAIPLIAVVLPLTRFLPAVIRLVNRTSIFRGYADLRHVEHGLRARAAAAPVDDLLRELERIEAMVAGARKSVLRASELYTLRMHLQLVREAVLARERAAKALPRAAAEEKA